MEPQPCREWPASNGTRHGSAVGVATVDDVQDDDDDVDDEGEIPKRHLDGTPWQ